MYIEEFLTIALIHLVAVASPGPDFAIVVRHSVRYGRRAAMYTSVGIGLAILLHVAYSLIGLSVLIKTTPWLYTGFSYAAAAYLIYLGWGAIRSKPSNQAVDEISTQEVAPKISDRKAFWTGFLTNGLNPKATLFFLSLFTAIIDVSTPFGVKLGYGLYLTCATAAWFCFLSYMLSTSRVAQFIGDKGHWLDRVMGVMLFALAAKLALDS